MFLGDREREKRGASAVSSLVNIAAMYVTSVSLLG
jgi:hypothetical protein